MKLSLPFRSISTIIVTLLVWAHIAWDYFHGGIPTHYLLQSPDLPGIPNWLGGIVLPFFTWFLLYRIHKRITGPETPVASEGFRKVVIRFLLALGCAITIAILFTLKIEIIDYIMLAILVLAFIFPIYKSEYLLGWVLGSTFTFGAIIPILFGSLLALLFFLCYQCPRNVIGFFVKSKTNSI